MGGTPCCAGYELHRAEAPLAPGLPRPAARALHAPPLGRHALLPERETCQTHYEDSGMGDNVTLTYDWKHFIYEDYDRYLYNRKCALRGPCDMLPCACTARSAHTAARRAAMHARSLTE